MSMLVSNERQSKRVLESEILSTSARFYKQKRPVQVT
jgi:hypothetical protein